MKRLLTFAGASLLVTGLTVLPVGAFAESSVSTGANVNTSAPAASVTTGTQVTPSKQGAAVNGSAAVATPKAAMPLTSGNTKTTINGHANGPS